MIPSVKRNPDTVSKTYPPSDGHKIIVMRNKSKKNSIVEEGSFRKQSK